MVIQELKHVPARDLRRCRQPKKSGWGVMVDWECETKKLQFLKAKLLELLAGVVDRFRNLLAAIDAPPARRGSNEARSKTKTR